MKNNLKDLTSKIPCPNNKQFKSSKKSKGTKKPPEKELYNAANSLDIISKQKDKVIHNNDQQPPIGESDNVKTILKPSQLEKRKQDGTEWKALKKIDYQRLETVLEEGQLSCEETQSKHNHNVSEKNVSKNFTEGASSMADLQKTKKLPFNNVIPFFEHPQMMEGKESAQPEAQTLSQYAAKQYRTCQKQQFLKRQRSHEKVEKIEDSHGEPADLKSKELNEKFSQTKRNIILNGMMEILPIFSNDKFVCSRDAISVAEYEELETLDKNMSASKKTLSESISVKDPDLKYFNSFKCVEKDCNDLVMENRRDCKEMSERKFSYKLLAEINVNQKTSSPFINSLLMLMSLANERRRRTKDSTVSLRENTSVQENVEEAEKHKDQISGVQFDEIIGVQ